MEVVWLFYTRFFCDVNNMPLIQKEHGKINKIYYPKGQNNADTLSMYVSWVMPRLVY